MTTARGPGSVEGVTDPSLSVRPVDVEGAELGSWLQAVRSVFLQEPLDDLDAAMANRRPILRRQRVTATVDARDRIVATFRSWDWTLTVPGGEVTADAISSVTVLPTHHRRGALTAMMTADLRSAVERGVPVAVLIASEAPIYGRFGFGPSTRSGTWRIQVPAARLRPDVPRYTDLELVSDAELRPVAPDVYARARRNGAMDRWDDAFWDTELGVVRSAVRPYQPHRAVVVRDDAGTVQGFARYRVRDDWTDRLPNATVSVQDLQAVDGPAYVALWDHLLGLDLVSTVEAWNRPVDEPLPWLLTDPRRAVLVAANDFIWSRLLDVPAALSARTYPGRSGGLAFEVVDARGWASGTYRLDVASDGTGVCAATDEVPELSVDVTALSAAWLGDGDLYAAVLGGRVTEHAHGAADRLTALLTTPRAPWTCDWF